VNSTTKGNWNGWRAEHGNEFDVPVEVHQASDLLDISWHNDGCPSFIVASLELNLTDGPVPPMLWTDHPDPELRDWDMGGRYIVAGDDHKFLYIGDSADEALEVLRKASGAL